MKRISDWAKVLLPLVGSGMILHYLFLWHERRHAVALHTYYFHHLVLFAIEGDSVFYPLLFLPKN